eukprot:m.85395 g.85395  ORF g.85395 m.85395 type:complete len:2284 (-) comp13009_c0_seq1:201-7052(-)
MSASQRLATCVVLLCVVVGVQSQTVRITSQSSLNTYKNTKFMNVSSVYLSYTGITQVEFRNMFDTLESVDGAFTVSGGIQASIILPNLVFIGDDLLVNRANSLFSFSAPNLTKVGGDISFQYCYKLATVSMPKLSLMVGKLIFSSSNVLTTVEMPMLTETESVQISSAPKLESLSFPNLLTVRGDFSLNRCSIMTSVDAPLLKMVFGQLYFYYLTSLVSITMPNIDKITGVLSLRYSSQLRDICNLNITGNDVSSVDFTGTPLTSGDTGLLAKGGITVANTSCLYRGISISDQSSYDAFIKNPSNVTEFSFINVNYNGLSHTQLKNLLGSVTVVHGELSIQRLSSSVKNINFLDNLQEVKGSLRLLTSSTYVTRINLPLLRSVASDIQITGGTIMHFPHLKTVGGKLTFQYTKMSSLVLPAVTKVERLSVTSDYTVTHISAPRLKTITDQLYISGNTKLVELEFVNLRNSSINFYNLPALETVLLPNIETINSFTIRSCGTLDALCDVGNNDTYVGSASFTYGNYALQHGRASLLSKGGITVALPCNSSDIEITSKADIATALAAIKKDGLTSLRSFIVTYTSITQNDFEELLANITMIHGDMVLTSLSSLRRIDLPKLTHVFGSITMTSCRYIRSVSMPNLQLIGQKLYVYYLYAALSLSFPMLNEANQLDIRSCSNLQTTDFTSLETVTSSIYIYSMYQMQSLSFSNLTTAGSISITYLGGLYSLQFPKLTTTSSFSLSSLTLLRELTAPMLTKLDSLSFSSLTALSSICDFAISADAVGSVSFSRVDNLEHGNPELLRLGKISNALPCNGTGLTITSVDDYNNALNRINAGETEFLFVTYQPSTTEQSKFPVNAINNLLANITRITGSLRVKGVTQTKEIEVTHLKYVGRDVSFLSLTYTTLINMPALTFVGDDVFFSGSYVTTVQLPILASIGGQLNLATMGNLATFSAPSLTTADYVYIYNNNLLKSLKLDSVTNIGSRGLYIRNCGGLSSITMPVLKDVQGQFSVSYLNSLSSIDMPELQTVKGAFQITYCIRLRDICSLDSLQAKSIIGSISLYGSNLLKYGNSDILKSVKDSETCSDSGKGLIVDTLDEYNTALKYMSAGVTTVRFILVGYTSITTEQINKLLQNITRVDGEINLNGLTIKSLQMPNLVHVNGTMNLRYMSSLGSMSFPKLEYVGDDLILYRLNEISSASFPSLKNVVGLLQMYNNKMNEFILPQLATVGSLNINYNTVLRSFALPELVSVNGSVSITSNTKLVEIILPKLNSVASTFYITGNTVLKDLCDVYIDPTMIKGRISLSTTIDHGPDQLLTKAGIVNKGGCEHESIVVDSADSLKAAMDLMKNISMRGITNITYAYIVGYSSLTLQDLEMLLSNVTSIHGDLYISGYWSGATSTLKFNNLEYVGGEFGVYNVATIGVLDVPKLKKIGESLTISSLGNLKTMSFPELVHAGLLTISSTNAPLSFPKLETVDGRLSVNRGYMTSLDFPMLRTIDGQLYLYYTSSVLTASFPQLQKVSKDIYMYYLSSMNKLEMPKINFATYFRCDYCKKLISTCDIGFPANSIPATVSLRYSEIRYGPSAFMSKAGIKNAVDNCNSTSLEVRSADDLTRELALVAKRGHQKKHFGYIYIDYASITTAQLTTLLSNITRVNGDITISLLKVGIISLPDLLHISGKLTLSSMTTAKAEIHLNKLQSVFGIEMNSVAILRFQAPVLENVVESVTLQSVTFLKTLSLPMLKNVGKDLFLSSCNNVITVQADMLNRIGGRLYMYYLSVLTTISLKTLGTLAGDLYLYNLNVLKSLCDFNPKLEDIFGRITLSRVYNLVQGNRALLLKGNVAASRIQDCTTTSPVSTASTAKTTRGSTPVGFTETTRTQTTISTLSATVFCKESFFKCTGGDRCYPNYYRCNGHPDCWNGEDEEGCTSTTNTFPSTRTLTSTTRTLTSLTTSMTKTTSKTRTSNTFSTESETITTHTRSTHTRTTRTFPEGYSTDSTSASSSTKTTTGTSNTYTSLSSSISTTTFTVTSITTTKTTNTMTTVTQPLCNYDEGYATCLDGSCYFAAYRCNGFFDCPDKSDEFQCTTQTTHADKPGNSSSGDSSTTKEIETATVHGDMSPDTTTIDTTTMESGTIIGGMTTGGGDSDMTTGGGIGSNTDAPTTMMTGSASTGFKTTDVTHSTSVASATVDASKDSSSDSSTTLIIVVVAIVVGFLVIIAVIIMYMKKSHNKEMADRMSFHNPTYEGNPNFNAPANGPEYAQAQASDGIYDNTNGSSYMQVGSMGEEEV